MVTTATTNRPIEYHITEDVKPQWLNVVRRLQSACHGNQGYAVLSIRVLVNGAGEPVCWTEPKRVKLEPKSLTFKALLDLAKPQGDTEHGSGGHPL